MVNFIIFVYLWPSVFTLLKTFYEPENSIEKRNKNKLVRYYVSSVNLVFLLLFCPAYLLTNKNIFYDLSLKTSISYLIWDLYYMVLRDTKEYALIYHHLAALLLWSSTFIGDEFKIPIIILYTLAELTNIPLFIIYYLLKTTDIKDESEFNKILYWKFIQVITYGPVRLLLMPYLLYETYFKMPPTSLVILGVMYLITVFHETHLVLTYRRERLKIIKSEDLY